MRARILDAARELFVRDGFAHVSIRKIASRIEYSPAAIYSYFPNKEEIFFALAEDGFRRFSLALEANLPSDDPLDMLRERFLRYYEFSKAQPEYFALMFVDRSVPRISRDWERFAFVKESRQGAIAVIERCVAMGLFPPTLNAAAAFHVLASAVHGAAVIRLGERFCPPSEADALVRDSLEVVIAGLRAGVHLTFSASFCPHAARATTERAEVEAPPAAPGDGREPKNKSEERPMIRSVVALVLTLALAGSVVACRRDGGVKAAAPAAAVDVAVGVAVHQPITRTLRVTGSLTADEEAEVAAETGGRVVGTPVERGSRVAEGDPLVRIAPTEAEASEREAEANVGQIEARLALEPGKPFDAERVPEVAAAKASKELAEADFQRIQSLLQDRVVSQAEFDQKRTQVEAARRQYDTARNSARQMFRQYEAAGARLALAKKSLSDTTVRAPFGGLVVERKVSLGDFVTRGTKVATVVRVNPLRVELTVPEQWLAAIKPGLSLTLQVDAYAGRSFPGQVRFVSPAVRADQRALTVEAVVPNADGLLKPGLFAAALLQGALTEEATLVPANALRTEGSISRLYVLHGDHVEERVVKVGQANGSLVEIVSGVVPGDQVAVTNVARLGDGTRVSVTAGQGASR